VGNFLPKFLCLASGRTFKLAHFSYSFFFCGSPFSVFLKKIRPFPQCPPRATFPFTTRNPLYDQPIRPLLSEAVFATPQPLPDLAISPLQRKSFFQDLREKRLPSQNSFKLARSIFGYPFPFFFFGKRVLVCCRGSPKRPPKNDDPPSRLIPPCSFSNPTRSPIRSAFTSTHPISPFQKRIFTNHFDFFPADETPSTWSPPPGRNPPLLRNSPYPPRRRALVVGRGFPLT